MKIIQVAPLFLLHACVTLPNGPARAIENCARRELDVIDRQRAAAPQIVLIRSERGHGTGFVAANVASKDLLIVTNHHVIAGGRRFEIDVEAASGARLTIANVEVLRIDPASDLAILRAPRPGDKLSGLTLTQEAPQIGQAIVVIGYPYVGGSAPAMTVEKGEVTTLDRIVGEQRFVQVNANINAGNSGGPVIDACGNVVGVVVAKSTTTDRTSFVIPAEKALALLRSAVEPETNSEAAALVQLTSFFSALERRQPTAGYISREFLEVRVQPLLAADFQNVSAKLTDLRKMLAHRGIKLEALAPEKMLDVVTNYLEPHETLIFALSLKMKAQQIGPQEASALYFEAFSGAFFGEVKGHRIEQLRMSTQEAEAVVLLDTTEGNAKTWRVNLAREWGEWRIAGFAKI